MEAKELRIGNWYERNDYSKHQITIDDLIYLSKGEDIKRIHPVIITREIMKSSGFEYHPFETNFGSVFKINIDHTYITVFLLNPFKSKIIISNHPNESSVVYVKLEFIHRLQNIVYDLAGKELEIKL